MAILSGKMTIIELKEYIQEKNLEAPAEATKSDMLKLAFKEYLERLKVDSLKEMLKDYGITGASGKTKSELVEMLIEPVIKSEILETKSQATKNKETDKKRELSEKARNSLAAKAVALIDSVKKESDMPSNNIYSENVQNSKENLKQYLSNLIHIESEVQFLKEYLIKLQFYKEENEKKLKKSTKELNEQIQLEVKYRTFDLCGEAELIKDKINNPKKYLDDNVRVEKADIGMDEPMLPQSDKPLRPIPPTLKTLLKPRMPKEPNYKTANFFNKKKVALQNEELKHEYEKEVNQYIQMLRQYEEDENNNNILQKQYEEDLAIYEQELCKHRNIQSNYTRMLKKYNTAYEKAYKEAQRNQLNQFIDSCNNALQTKKQEIEIEERKASEDLDTVLKTAIAKLPESQVKILLTEQLNLAKKQLKETVKARNQLYAYNIVYGKYRNYVAMSTIYEYIDSGRCETLDGADGAYNLFETELRANLIISQLSAINASLEQIKGSQFVLYKELKEVNKNLKNIDNSVCGAINAIHEVTATLEETNNKLDTISSFAHEIEQNTSDIAYNSETIAKNSTATLYYTKEIAKNSAVTAYNTAMTAHYARKNAELANALGFMIALK